MTKRNFTIVLSGVVFATVACGNSVPVIETPVEVETQTAETEELSGPIEGTYSIHVQGDDWGCGVDKAIISLNKTLSDISEYQFSVVETKTAIDWSTFQISEVQNERTINNVYLSDAEGNKVNGDSDYVTVEMYISPDEGSPYLYNVLNYGLNEWSDPYTLDIKVTCGEEEFTVDAEYKDVLTNIDDFDMSSYISTDGMTYSYASYTPDAPSDTLVVWLHGIGEGGTDPMVTLLNAEVSALADDEFQTIMGGANILVPQCPTYWMDNDGQRSNYIDGAIVADGTSVYTESLHEFINAYKNQIGATKVIIAGCSNGGYMTMILAMNYSDEYDAYVPICEAMDDTFISDENIATLKDLKMFFIYAQNDPLVPPSQYEIPTLERLKAVNAENICIFAPEDVHDLSGRFIDENGEAYQYYGHGSWQYFFNNEAVCDDDGTSCWNWMADALK